MKWPPEHYLRRKLEGLAASGINVAVATSDRDFDAEMRSGVGRVRLPRRDEPAAVALLRLARDCLLLGSTEPPRASPAVARGQTDGGRTIGLLRSQVVVMLAKPDLVHFEWESVAVDFLPLFEACRCPVVVSSHGGIHVRPKIGDRRIVRAYPTIFARAAAVHCVSEAVREEAVRFGLDRAKARVIHPAVDTDFFSPAPSDVRDPEELRVIGLGRLNWIKGYDYALEAVASLVRAGVPVTYEILGGEPSAESGKASDRGRLLYLIHELGLEGRVRLLGKVSQEVVRERLRASDVLLQASLSEGLPNAVLEAMACALPVVVTDCGGVREAVEHGVEGLVCPRRSPQALADALGSLRDPALARKLGEAGRARVVADFTLERQLESFRRLYGELAARSRLADPRADEPPAPGRGFRPKAGVRIAGEDAHPRPLECPPATQADGECAAGAVARSLRPPRRRAHRAGRRGRRSSGRAGPAVPRAPPAIPASSALSASSESVLRSGCERVCEPISQPASESEADLCPGQRQQLVLVRAAHIAVDALPRHRRVAADPAGRHEQRGGKPEAGQERERLFADRAVGVVERHRDRLPARAREDRLAERRAAIAALEQVAQLPLEALDGNRARGRPAVAEPVITENEGVPDRSSSRHESHRPPG